MLKKDLRIQPFSDSMLRDMAISFPRSKFSVNISILPTGTELLLLAIRELCRIPGIDRDKVDRYGPQFMKLIRDSKRRYDELKEQQQDQSNGIVPDPNHHNVVNLDDSSDNFTDDEALFVDEDSTFGNNTEAGTSRYFSSQAPVAQNSGMLDPGY